MSQPTPEELWTEMHVKQGKSAAASAEAAAIVDVLNTNDFSDPRVTKLHGEYARIAAVTGLAATKKAESWPETREDLLRTIQVIVDHYPLAADAKTATKKGNYWEGVYGEQSAQLICLRDVLHLAQVLKQILSDKEIEKWMGGLEKLLKKLNSDSGEKFALIFLTEEAEYQTASHSYREFLSVFGPQTEMYDANGFITVSAKMLGRAVDQLDLNTIITCLRAINDAAKSTPSLSKFALKELAANFSKLMKNRSLRKKIKFVAS